MWIFNKADVPAEFSKLIRENKRLRAELVEVTDERDTLAADVERLEARRTAPPPPDPLAMPRGYRQMTAAEVDAYMVTHPDEINVRARVVVPL